MESFSAISKDHLIFYEFIRSFVKLEILAEIEENHKMENTEVKSLRKIYFSLFPFT